MKESGGGQVYDYVIIGSGFGGSVSALRLTEKGYRVLILERGKRFRDQDYAKSTWNVFKYLWLPAMRCFGILQISPFRDVFVLHGSGVGGGSLGYATVLMQPEPEVFEAPAWKNLVDWGRVLPAHFETAKRMLGVTRNPQMWHSDQVMKKIAAELGMDNTFRTTEVGIYFGSGKPGEEAADPFFDGEGPVRNACNFCGGCMVGCRYNAKNTLVKNYLYLAEKWGTEVRAECEVRDVQPLPDGQPDGARYEVLYRNSTKVLLNPEKSVRARNIVLAAGALGTMRLLFRCRDITRSLPRISGRLGDMVRTNNEALLGSTSRVFQQDFSKGIAITSIFHADPVTTVEPVRYPAGSSFMRLLAGPLVESGGSFLVRLLKTLAQILVHPLDFARTQIFTRWAERTTILLVMQTEDNRIKMRPGRSLFTLFRKNLLSYPDEEKTIPSKIDIGHQIARRFAEHTDGVPVGSINEGLFNIPMTAHILGGCPIGRNDREGVVDPDCQVHNYPGLFVVDGSIMPGNPGVNPSLTITALAEYAMSCVPPKEGAKIRTPVGVRPGGPGNHGAEPGL
jgi:cholesterol oxidase